MELRLEKQYRGSAEAFSGVYLPRTGSGLVRLDNVVRIVPATSPTRIDRLDRQRQVSLLVRWCRIRAGRSYRSLEGRRA